MTGKAKTHYLEDLVRREALLWGNEVASKYHGAAAASMEHQWVELILPLLSKHRCDLRSVVDFACGYGRNSRKLLEAGAQKLTLVDVNPDNVDHCRLTFKHRPEVEVVQNNGFDLSILASSRFTHLYTFDSVVHFDLELVISYMSEFSRVLTPGGTAFIHHSNYSQRPGSDFRENPHWRNFMTADLFKHVASRHEFIVLEQKIIPWGGIPNLDCISILRRK